MPIRDPFSPSTPLLRVLDSQIERKRIAEALGTSVSGVDSFASGQGSMTLNEILSLLEAAGLQVIESTELRAISHFAAEYLRGELEARRQ